MQNMPTYLAVFNPMFFFSSLPDNLCHAVAVLIWMKITAFPGASFGSAPNTPVEGEPL